MGEGKEGERDGRKNRRGNKKEERKNNGHDEYDGYGGGPSVVSDWPDTPPQTRRRRNPPPQGAPGPQQASATVGEGKSEIRRVTMHCRRPPVIGWTPNRPCMSNVTTSSGYPNAQKKIGHAFPTLGACQSPWCRWGGWRLPGGYRGRTARIQANQSPGVWKHLERDREIERERERPPEA